MQVLLTSPSDDFVYSWPGWIEHMIKWCIYFRFYKFIWPKNINKLRKRTYFGEDHIGFTSFKLTKITSKVTPAINFTSDILHPRLIGVLDTFKNNAISKQNESLSASIIMKEWVLNAVMIFIYQFKLAF